MNISLHKHEIKEDTFSIHFDGLNSQQFDNLRIMLYNLLKRDIEFNGNVNQLGLDKVIEMMVNNPYKETRIETIIKDEDKKYKVSSDKYIGGCKDYHGMRVPPYSEEYKAWVKLHPEDGCYSVNYQYDDEWKEFIENFRKSKDTI